MRRELFILTIIVVVIFVSIIFYSHSISDTTRNEINEHFLAKLGVKNGRDKVLLMFAHPDDETMFFSPTLLALKEGGAKIHLLCLSHGDHKNLGNKRREEMYRVADSLGIPRDQVRIGNFVDKPGLKWSPEEVSQVLNQCVSEWNIDSVISFDGIGVSGHTNHISCYEALKLYKENDNSRRVKLFALNSGPRRTRYAGALGTLGKPESGNTTVSNSARKVFSIMNHHESQNTWWRKLHIALSSHTYVNNFYEL